MAVKTTISKKDFLNILSDYNLGEVGSISPIKQGTVQTNYIVLTSKGKFVFRYYENRSFGSVLFESNLIKYLNKRKYPCPQIIGDKHGKYAGLYKKKPYAIFEFVEGKHIKKPTKKQKQELIKRAAQLQTITRGYRPAHKNRRWNYSPSLCRKLARKESEKIGTQNAKKKLTWMSRELSNLKLPNSMPKGICHCDFHFSNVLYKNGRFAALIDFDDANYTYLLFDLVGLIEGWAWSHKSNKLSLSKAREVVKEYTKHRPLNDTEKRHLYDVYKLGILFDAIWFFERGKAKDFYERRKIEYLDELGRDRFYTELFA